MFPFELKPKFLTKKLLLDTETGIFLYGLTFLSPKNIRQK